MALLDGYKDPSSKFTCKIPKDFFVRNSTKEGDARVTVFESGDGKTKILVSYVNRYTDVPLSDEELRSLAASSMSGRLKRAVEELPVVSLSGEETVNGNTAIWYEYDKDSQKEYSDFFIKGSSSYDISFTFEEGVVDRDLVSFFLKSFRAL